MKKITREICEIVAKLPPDKAALFVEIVRQIAQSNQPLVESSKEPVASKPLSDHH